MRSLRRFFTRVLNFARKRAHEERLREEIQEHITLQTDENLRAGLSPAEARRQAILKFGAVEVISQNYQAERGLPWIEDLLQDIRYSVRLLRKSPGFTMAAVLTLALAIGANAVVFGVLNALILRPLNLPREESLYGIDRDGIGFESYPNYRDLRDRNHSFEDLIAYRISQAGLDTGTELFRPWVYETTGNYFDALGIQPYLGRFFHSSDEHGTNSAPYIVLTYGSWHAHFQGDRSVVGRTVLLNKHPFTIIGVTPPGFNGTSIFFMDDLFVPIVNQEQLAGENVLE